MLTMQCSTYILKEMSVILQLVCVELCYSPSGDSLFVLRSDNYTLITPTFISDTTPGASVRRPSRLFLFRSAICHEVEARPAYVGWLMSEVITMTSRGGPSMSGRRFMMFVDRHWLSAAAREREAFVWRSAAPFWDHCVDFTADVGNERRGYDGRTSPCLISQEAANDGGLLLWDGSRTFTPLPDKYPRRQFPPEKHPLDNYPTDNCPLDNYPLDKYLPRPMPNPHQTNIIYIDNIVVPR